MKILFLVNVLSTVFVAIMTTSVCFAASGDSKNAFPKISKQLRTLRTHLQTEENAAPFDISFKNASIPHRTSAHSIASFLIGRMSLLQEESSGDSQSAKYLSSSASMAPECLLLLMERHSQSHEGRTYYQTLLARLLPLSVWQKQIDGQDSNFVGLIKPPRPEVPIASRRMLIDIAGALKDAGFYNVAWPAYAEAVYIGFDPPWSSQPLEESWLSSEAAKYWLHAAECARKADRPELAWEYLMKAAVFGSDELYEQTLVIARNWENEADGKANRKNPPLSRDAKSKLVLSAIKLYQEINAHPRAIELIDSNRNLFDEPEALRKEVLEDWRRIVKDLSRAAERVSLYGTQVYPDGDPADVRIPWALSDEALEQVRKEIQDSPARKLDNPDGDEANVPDTPTTQKDEPEAKGDVE